MKPYLGGTVDDVESNQAADVYIATASFENERSVAATRLCRSQNVGLAILIVFRGTLSDEGKKLKQLAINELVEEMTMMDSQRSPIIIFTGRYDYGRVMEELQQHSRARGISWKDANVVIDISCFTAVQLVFLVRSCLEEWRPKQLTVLYTRPKFYESSNKRRLTRPSYSLLPMPIRSLPRAALRETHHQAVVTLGHEGMRSLCAWRAVDPIETCLIFPVSSSPRLMQICETQNRILLDLAKSDSDVVNEYLPTLDIQACRHAIRKFITDRKGANELRVTLVPFGPKPLIVGALLGIMDCSDVEAEIMYATPRSYSAHYSSGVDGVFGEVVV